MHINDFDDDCLLLIFERVPLQHVLHSVARVCSRWKTLQVRTCVARRSLTVLIGQEPLQLISQSQFTIPFIDRVTNPKNHDPTNNPIEYLNPEFERLVYPDIDQKLASQLFVAFPQIKSLSIVLCDVEGSKFVYFEHLLEHWKHCLDSLQLWLRKYHLWVPEDRWCDPLTFCSDLMNAINSLSALKCLLIESPDILYYPEAEMPVMSQLESLYFSHHAPSMFWLDKYVVSSKNLKQIGLGCMYMRFSSEDSLNEFLKNGPKFLSKITHLPVLFNFTFSQLNQFSNNITHLRTISLSMRELSITELVQCLTKLRQLIHLNLCIETKVYPNQTNPKWLQSTSKASKIDHQISSVKILTLSLSLNSHSDLEHFISQLLFPNLQFIQINQRFCNRCAECENKFKSTQSNHITRECIQKIVEPFKFDQLSSKPVIVVLGQDGQKMFDNNQICEDLLETQVKETPPTVITTFDDRTTLKGKILKFFRFK